MKVKVISEQHEDFGKEFKLRRMNYDQAVVNYPSSEGIKVIENKDLEFITESEVDEFLINNRDLLKIKLNRGISIMLYKGLLESLNNQEIELSSLNLLKDKYKVNKRGIWEKEILCVINKKMPFSITASGQNFKKINYNINCVQVEIDEFLDICTFEIKKIQKEIEEKNESLSRYGEAVNLVESRDEEQILIE